MSRRRLSITPLVLIAFALLIGCSPPGDQAATSWAPPALAGTDADWQEPNAREVISRMIEFMAGQDVLLAEALASYETVQESGQKLHFDLLQRIAIHKPDKLFWVPLHGAPLGA